MGGRRLLVCLFAYLFACLCMCEREKGVCKWYRGHLQAYVHYFFVAIPPTFCRNNRIEEGIETRGERKKKI